MKTQEIIEQVNEAIAEVFKTIPAGFKEYIYESALCYELEKRNIKYYQQKRLPFYHKGEYLCSYIPDLLIPTKDGNYVLELKHKASLDDGDKIQLQRYLFGMDEKNGSLVNFKTRDIEDYELVPKKHKKEKIVNKANEPRISEKAQQIINTIEKHQNVSDEPAKVWISPVEIAKITNLADSTVKTLLRKLVEQDVLIYKKRKGYQISVNNSETF